MPVRTATAEWKGGLKSGTGSFEGETGLRGSYNFSSRFEDGSGSNPEELLAAAEAACFSMALSGALEKNGTPPEVVRTIGKCTVEKVGDGFTVTGIALDTTATVPGIDNETFQKIAAATRTGCPVSRALSSVNISLTARLT